METNNDNLLFPKEILKSPPRPPKKETKYILVAFFENGEYRYWAHKGMFDSMEHADLASGKLKPCWTHKRIVIVGME